MYKLRLLVGDSNSFHTTMVLTQLLSSLRPKAGIDVSIPLWFSRNVSIGRSKASSPIAVSIPLWFSRNRTSQSPSIQDFAEFPYHYGSHATYSAMGIAFLVNVSIPLWFSRNIKRLSASFFYVNLFPYHYGSHATDTVRHRVYGILKFPYHYGSHATS